VPSRGEPHPVSVRHPLHFDKAGRPVQHGRERYYPVCGCGWVGVPQDRERRAWDLAWEHAGVDWRAIPVQLEPRALRRPRSGGQALGQALLGLPVGYRGPVPCHFGLADKFDGCGNGYLADQHDGVVTYHGCRGVIPPTPWQCRPPAEGLAGSGLGGMSDQLAAAGAARGEVCVCPCHRAPDEDTLPRRCRRCQTLLPASWPIWEPCQSCAPRQAEQSS